MGRFENLEDALYISNNEYGFPDIHRVDNIPNIDEWIGFNYVKSTGKRREKTGVHFFIDDYQFERVWNFPYRYGEVLSDYGCIVSPDFSTYRDFPKAVRVFNTYRNRWLTRYWQDYGLTVVPNIEWGLKEDDDYYFSGIPEGGIVAVSNIGSMTTRESRAVFMRGYNEMLTRIQPNKVLFYAHTFDDYKGPVHFIRYNIDKTTQK